MTSQIKQLPNALSLLRITAAITFPAVSVSLQLPILIFALITEFLDGYIARKFNWETQLGKILDPIADKLFAFSVGLTLVISNKIELLSIIFIYSRDITVSLGFLCWLFTPTKTHLAWSFSPNLMGKLTTVLQYLYFLNILFKPIGYRLIFLITSIVSISSAILYTIEFFKKNQFRKNI